MRGKVTVSGERPTFSRTKALVAACRVEQTEPDYFYRMLAADSVALTSCWAELDGALMLDVGGGPGYFAEEFEKAGARYLSVEYDASEAAAGHEDHRPAVVGDGQALPFRSGAFDLCFSSNVLEHVPDPEAMCREMVRVT